jgi:aryl-phospho-beta-D-glucosidase BglC (GH1 family)
LVGAKVGTNAVQVRGVSLGWSNSGWESARFFDETTVNAMVDSWRAEIIRAPMGYSENGGYQSQPAQNKTRIETVVNAAIAKGVYVIIDWHSHNAHSETAAAKTFFAEMAQKYGSYDNVIFEIYNEPLAISWQTIKSYAEQIIPAIRQHSDNLILVGTPSWDQDIDVVTSSTKINDSNIAYVLHFYAAEHPLDYYENKANSALNANVPIFVSEYGTVMANGDGMHSAANTNAWLAYLDNKKISSCAWSVNDKKEGAAFFGTGTSFNKTNWTTTSSMTESGQYIYSKLTGYYANAPWRTCSFSTTPNSSSSGGGGSGISCDYGYPSTGQTAGCYDNATSCDLEWGKIVTSCNNRRTDLIYCDWGPYKGPYDPNYPQTTGGGCVRIDDTSSARYSCETDYGNVVSKCPASSL